MLGTRDNSWCARTIEDHADWMEFDLHEVKFIAGVVVQGKPDGRLKQFPTSFRVKYRAKCTARTPRKARVLPGLPPLAISLWGHDCLPY